MNGLIPTLIAVLLAEAGAPLAALARARGQAIAFAIAALVFAAAGIGWQFSSMMAADARQLMLGVLMVFAGAGQLWGAKPLTPTIWGTMLAIGRSPAPGLAFGFAAFFGEPFTPALGALAGVALAAGAAALDVAVPKALRRALGAALVVAGVVAGAPALLG